MNGKMIADSHIHMLKPGADPVRFAGQLESAGVDEAVILSIAPAGTSKTFPDYSDAERLRLVTDFCSGHPAWHPFYWIDPMAGDAAEQVDFAEEGMFLPSEAVEAADFELTKLPDRS